MNLNKFKPKRRSIKEWVNDIDKIKTIGIVARFFEMIFFMISLFEIMALRMIAFLR